MVVYWVLTLCCCRWILMFWRIMHLSSTGLRDFVQVCHCAIRLGSNPVKIWQSAVWKVSAWKPENVNHNHNHHHQQQQHNSPFWAKAFFRSFCQRSLFLAVFLQFLSPNFLAFSITPWERSSVFPNLVLVRTLNFLKTRIMFLTKHILLFVNSKDSRF